MSLDPTSKPSSTPTSPTVEAETPLTNDQLLGIGGFIGSIGGLFAGVINNGTAEANSAAAAANQNYTTSQEQSDQLQKLIQG